jgi:hypothetical protein
VGAAISRVGVRREDPGLPGRVMLKVLGKRAWSRGRRNSAVRPRR